jgi:Histidine kinase-, DNA gyrase B-, and HSP90-like ATPase
MSFDTTPKPYFLQAMRSQSWNAAGALAELVDNSFGPGRGNAGLCEITYDPRRGMMTIVDDGAGMESIGRLFQLGNTIGRAPGDIGRFGSGGTMAILWLASDVAVYTLRDGKVSHDKVIWSDCLARDRFPYISDSWETASLSNCPPELLTHGQGTAIVLKIAAERGKLRADNIQRDLAKTYGPGIRAGKQIVWTTLGRGGGTQLLADQTQLPNDPTKLVSFEITEIAGRPLSVTGQVGLVEDLKLNDAGVTIGYGARVITKTKDCFVSPDGEERFAGASVTGWLDLGDEWLDHLTTTKTGIDDRPLWDALMGYVFAKIKPLLEAADDEKLTLELDDIALSLQHLFDGNTKVNVPRAPADVPEDLGPGEGIGVSPPDDPDVPEISDSDRHVERPARAEIDITKATDEFLDGVLCKAERSASTITVFVNRDHPIIELALIQKPVNRTCLTMVVVNEIANVMAKDPELCQLAFKPKIASQLLEVIDDAERERKILRLMSDNVRTKRAS